jgi:gas vesicle protein
MSDNRTIEFLKGLVLGGVVGAVVALLYAPKSGKETREDISEKMEDLYEKAREEYEDSLNKARKAYDSAIARMKDLETDAKKKAEEVEEIVEDIIEKGKTTVEGSKGRLNAAKSAFKEEKDNKEEKE